MMDEMQLLNTLQNYAGHPWMISAIIFFSTFILEDAASVASGLAASYELIGPFWAYFALLAGIVLGDFGLYGLGYLGNHSKRAENFLNRKNVQKAKDWLGHRIILSIVAARFIPGARLPTYTAIGFFKLSFTKFAVTVFFAGALWSSIVFYAVYKAGMIFVEELGHWRWPIAISLIIAVIVLPKLFDLLNKRHRHA